MHTDTKGCLVYIAWWGEEKSWKKKGQKVEGKEGRQKEKKK